MIKTQFKKKMEVKAIKEEVADKEATSYTDTIRAKSKGTSKEHCKSPDLPDGGRTTVAPTLSPTAQQPRSPRQLSTNGVPSPLNRGSSTDDSTPPLPASTTNALNLETSQPSEQSHCVYSANITRPLIKIKRFLSTLVLFGNEINADIGDRVKSFVLNLVSSNLSIEEFHHLLQDVTNFPLRPFVLPFLRTHIPFLQREVQILAKSNKQSTLQYVRSHDHVVLDSIQSSSSEAAQIFMPNDAPTGMTGIKRRANESNYENGITDSQDICPLKRIHASTPSTLIFPQANMFLSNPAANVSAIHHHMFDYGNTLANNSNQQQASNSSEPSGSGRADEEWRNIHVMLNCILSMVEKTKRAITILQQRSTQDVTSEWLRKQDVGVDLKKTANEIMMQAVRQTEDKIAEVRRRAEEAVNEVKRQAVVELQRAVTAAECKASELVAAERLKIDRLLLLAMNDRKHQEDNSSEARKRPGSPSSHQNSCWNCGRKAHETCSGCNLARYCGPFCQHKDWENHHQVCVKETRLLPNNNNNNNNTNNNNNNNTTTNGQEINQTNK